MGIHRDAADLSLPSILGEIARDDLHGRGLAGPIRSQEPDDLAPGDAKGDLVEGLLFSIILYKFLYFDRHYCWFTTRIYANPLYYGILPSTRNSRRAPVRPQWG